MIVVLHADDLEPITVLDIPRDAMDMLIAGRPVNINIPAPAMNGVIKCVRVWAEPFHRNGQQSWMLFTKDEEAALLLKPGLLPGQQNAWQKKFNDGLSSRG